MTDGWGAATKLKPGTPEPAFPDKKAAAPSGDSIVTLMSGAPVPLAPGVAVTLTEVSRSSTGKMTAQVRVVATLRAAQPDGAPSAEVTKALKAVQKLAEEANTRSKAIASDMASVKAAADNIAKPTDMTDLLLNVEGVRDEVKDLISSLESRLTGIEEGLRLLVDE